VLTYHQVTHVAGFEAQMAYLAGRYRALAMPELLALVRAGRPLPARALLITFDDGYRNFAEVAWPILKRHGLPATLFVPTAYPDRPDRLFWWDTLAHALGHTARRDAIDTPAGLLPLASAAQRQKALSRLKAALRPLPDEEAQEWSRRLAAELNAPPQSNQVLGWDELRRLEAEGVTLGAHTQTHPNLAHLEAEEVRREVEGSLADLDRETGRAWPIFAYPAGSHRPETIEAVRRAGVLLAFTTRRGTNDMSRAGRWLALRRNNVGAGASWPVLWARLLQATAALDPFRSLMERIADRGVRYGYR
jgi:peptidoglycan/xylan/chitin deacetylase (PgdA/CDA1 family)